MKTIITGPAGKMGKAMVNSAYKNPLVELVGAVGPKGRDYVGKDIGLVCNLGEELNIKIHDNLEAIISSCDIVLDCTLPEISIQALESCVKHKKAFVSGTTGFFEDDQKAFLKAGETIPVIIAYNTSRMMNILFDIIRKAASEIGLKSDIDLIDMHDNKKPDSPSGTSKVIAEIISEELNYDCDNYTYGRKGKEIRKEKSIAFNSIRSGGFPGSIKVIFGSEDEKMELSAQVYNMNTYANGMIEAGLFLKGKSPGLYSLREVFDQSPIEDNPS